MNTRSDSPQESRGAALLPWANGPGEILQHGLDLLRSDSDIHRRLALISIDNSVELMIRTFIGLPKRVHGLDISRKQLAELGESFPALLDALERYVPSKMEGIDLGVIEWYHRLRNELYHQGNGLTIERDKVEIYAELAKVLFARLFGFALIERSPKQSPKTTELLGEFLMTWADIARRIGDQIDEELARQGLASTLPNRWNVMATKLLSDAEALEVEELRKIRNRAAHAEPGWQKLITPELMTRVRKLAERIGISGVK